MARRKRSRSKRPLPIRLLTWLIALPLVLVLLVITAYCFGAVWFDGPLGGPGATGNIALAVAWLVVFAVAVLAIRRPGRRLLAAVIGFAVVLVPWSFIRPSNDRDWQPDFRETGWVDEDGDTLTFHNVRDFDYARDGTPAERWETHTRHWSKLRGVDYFHDAFGGDLLAHPILSFDFGDEGNLCLSIETRRETGESFSTLGGLYKMFDLQYMFGTEDDFIRVRTNVRDEPVHLYRLKLGPEKARDILRESIAAQNELRNKPRFYNVITSNCTTSLRAQHAAEERTPFDWRMLINGRLDELVWERGAIVDGGLDFPALRAQALINDAAVAAHDARDFSRRIRDGRVGYD